MGGPVDFRSDGRLRDWITYFIEYNSYLPPWPDGDSFNVGSANAAYRKETLDRQSGCAERGVLGSEHCIPSCSPKEPGSAAFPG